MKKCCLYPPICPGVQTAENIVSTASPGKSGKDVLI